MKKQLYLDIKNLIKSITDDSGNLVFQHFDLWNRQVEFLEQENPFKCPAVFIEFGDFEWDTITDQNEQETFPSITLHIVTEWFGQTADNSPIESEMLDYLDLPEVIKQPLEALHTDKVVWFQRKTSKTNHDHERYVDSQEIYQFRILETD